MIGQFLCQPGLLGFAYTETKKKHEHLKPSYTAHFEILTFVILI